MRMGGTRPSVWPLLFLGFLASVGETYRLPGGAGKCSPPHPARAHPRQPGHASSLTPFGIPGGRGRGGSDRSGPNQSGTAFAVPWAGSWSASPNKVGAVSYRSLTSPPGLQPLARSGRGDARRALTGAASLRAQVTIIISSCPVHLIAYRASQTECDHSCAGNKTHWICM